jgi:RNA polymerase sigma-70 factor (ECF subfamily)
MGNAVRYKQNKDEQMEIVNNAFIKVIKNIDRFQPGTAYFSWVKKIVQREIIDDFRKNKRYKELFTLDLDLTSLHLEQESDVDNSFETEEIEEMFNVLAPATRLVFNLFAIDGYDTRAISEELGISYETVKWHIKEARKKLRELLSKQ